MALDVKHLNADSSFLLTFTPTRDPSLAQHTSIDACTVLIDPWLVGSFSIFSRRFQLSRLVRPPCLNSLADLPTPNLIIISQGKPDHCHRETLCTLPKDVAVTILAAPEAYRQIKGWRHFTRANLLRLEPYRPRRNATFRLPIASSIDSDGPGELTVTYIEQTTDLTGLHNGVGITYRSPGPYPVSLSRSQLMFPLTPPISPLRSQQSLNMTTTSSESMSPIASPSHIVDGIRPSLTTRSSEVNEILSIVYTPHGLSSSAIEQYAASFLKPLGALPLTALFHAVNTEQNPWYMGGNVVSGLPGGIELVKRLGARYWISAHDEIKETTGLAVKLLKSRVYDVEEAQGILDRESGPSMGSTRTKIVDLDIGEEFRI